MKTQKAFLFSGLLCLALLSSSQSANYQVTKDIIWASPDGFDLTMDIYSPSDAKKLPVLVIFHGGGWLINNKSIMDQMSDYVANDGKYVVCNVNYRLLVDQENSVTMDQIVEDVFGAVLWIQENIKSYGGDPKRVAVTGDSAGGHLSSMVVMMGHRLSSTGIDEEPLGFNPSYLPRGKTADKLAKKGGIKVQAGLISYGAFDLYASCKDGGFEEKSNIFWQLGGAEPRPIFGLSRSVEDDPELYELVSPIRNLPKSTEKKLPPQLFTVGTKDNLTTPKSVKAYRDSVQSLGHETEYWEHKGRPHAFLDSGVNQFLGIEFEEDAPEALDRMLQFLDKTFYD